MDNILEKIEFDYKVDIKNITTIKTSGKVKGVFYPKTQKELIFIYNFLNINNIPNIIIGNGSNILFSPKSQKMIIISTKKMKKLLKINKNDLICSSSIFFNNAFQYALKNNLSGFEFLANIPGTIGGGLIMNASAFNKSIFDILNWVKILDKGKIKYLKKEQIKYDYRFSSLKDKVILSASFHLTPKDKNIILQDYLLCLKKRRINQPFGFSFGCTFKNPKNYSAGFLIEQCGLKGFKYKNAEISNKHANFIINKSDSSFDDILYLINLARKKVKEKYNINLETEVIII